MRAEYANSGTALIRLKDAMTVVNEYMLQKSAKRVKAVKSAGVTNRDAFETGRKAADAIKLRGESQKLDQQKRIGGK